MDNLLIKLESQSDVKSISGLSELIYVAKESVKIHAVPVHERRAKCFAVFHQILTANKLKLSLLALEGLQLMLRDSALLNDSCTNKPEDTLSVQMLRCLNQLPESDKQIQCQLITVMVQLISSNEVNVSLNDVYEALQICTKTFTSTEDTSVKLSVRAAITQFLNSFCSNRHAKVFQHSNPSQEEIAVLMDMTAILTEVYKRLSTAETIDDLQLGLDSVYSVLSAQPDTFHKHPPLLNVFSTELVPCLLCLLHGADEKVPPTKSLLSITPTTPLKFSVFSMPESARSFYQVVEQVIRLMSKVPDGEPLTLELLRNCLLCPHPSKRGEALKLLKRLFSTPQRFVEYLDLYAREPQFWPVVLSCLEECAKVPGSEGAVESIRVMNSLFHGLDCQLQSNSICQKLSPIVHEILENAHKSRQLKITQKRRISGEAEKLAHKFVNRLSIKVVEWMSVEEIHEMDEKIQKFASLIAQEFTDLESDHNQTQSLLNTDAVYLTTFAALSFCHRSRDADEPDRACFFGQVWGSGCIVYGNENWLNAIYDILVTHNLFDQVGEIDNESALIRLIEDYDGHNKKYLSTFIEDKVEVIKDEKYINFENWIRNQLASSWSTVLSILSKFSLKLDKKGASDKLQTDGVEATFEATTSLLSLIIKLRLSSEITWIFERIGEEVCLLEDLRHFVIKSSGSENKKPWRINRIDALCIGLLLDNCIECGTLSPSSWKHTVRTIEYVTELEKYLFRLTKTANVNYDSSSISLTDLLGKIIPNELSLATVGRVLDELMLKIDGFFEDAPKILNLPSMCALLTAMCTADEDNLRSVEGVSLKIVTEIYVPACALPRIARLVGGDVQRRPLVHRLRIWGTVKDHYVETISPKFPYEIAKLSIAALYDSMRALLGTEPEGSCFHQSLFTAYQTILCEVCSAETQEQIVGNLANFIEDAPHQIGSGWKPLFGALKAIRISPAKQKTNDENESFVSKSALTPANYAVINVFKRYIQIGDPQILIPTALEFIHCIVHYLQSTEGFEQLPPNPDFTPSNEHERDTQIGKSVFSFVSELKRQLLLCFENAESQLVPAPASIINRLRHREQATEVVDEELVNFKLEDVSDLATCLLEDLTFEIQPSRLNEKAKIIGITFPWSEWTDSQKCVSELLLSLIDELAGLALTCSRQILPQLLTGLSEFVGSLRESKLAEQRAQIAKNRREAEERLAKRSLEKGQKQRQAPIAAKKQKTAPFDPLKGHTPNVNVQFELISTNRIAVTIKPFHEQVKKLLLKLPSTKFEKSSGEYHILCSEYRKAVASLKALSEIKCTVKELPIWITKLFVDKGFVEEPPTLKEDVDKVLESSTIEKNVLNELFEYQREGVAYGLKKNGNLLIADEMGLGKSLQALAIARNYLDDWPLYIFCPSSVKYSWKKTFADFLPNVDDLTVIEKGSDSLPNHELKNTVVIMSYDLMSSRENELIQKNIRVIIFDESHLLKESTAKRTKVAMKLASNALHKILLSGTPALGRPSELFTQIQILSERLFPSFSQYANRYCQPTKTKFGFQAKGAEHLRELATILQHSFMIRRLKADVLGQLPTKTREILYLDSSKLKASLEELKKKRLEFVDGDFMGEGEGEGWEHFMHYYQDTGIAKAESVMDYVLSTYFYKDAPNVKILLFGHHTAVLDIYSDRFKKAGIKTIRIDGSTVGPSRERAVNRFQEDSEIKAAVLSIVAASTGITLTAANKVIFGELHWTPGTFFQAEDRAHRVGQKNPVFIQYILARDTADDLIWPKILAKIDIIDSLKLTDQKLTDVKKKGYNIDEMKSLHFGVYAICSSILPLIQKWARREHLSFIPSSQIHQSLRNLKQSTAVFTELIVDYVRNDPKNKWNEYMITQIFILFNDLISHASPFITGTGSACLRHLVSSLTNELSAESLNTIVYSLWRATCLSLAPVRKLIGKFVANSVDVNGDIGEVHVIVKEDAQTTDYTELRAMALQIFQIENREQQAMRCRQTSVDEDGDDKKRPQFAYVFVFRPKVQNLASAPPEKAVTMDEIVAGLMSAQSLLQLFSLILLGSLNSSSFSGESDAQNLSRSTTTNEFDISIGKRLSRTQIGKILACLDAVNFVAEEFDCRPSLKYLLQKLINGDQVANLYKLQVASQAIKLQTIYELAKQLSPTKDDIIKVTKGQGGANSNLTFLRLISTLIDQTFLLLEDLEGQAIKSPGSLTMRDRIDVDCGQLRLSEEFENSGMEISPQPARTNPFLSRIHSLKTSGRFSTDSNDGVHISQLSDLDLRLIAQSEIVAILIERVVREDAAIFRIFLPLFLPKVRHLMRICPAKRARVACSEFLERLDQEWEIST